MANPEHREILKQGVEQWNKWREEHPEVRPVLREVLLSRADLSGANLYKADLHEANLSGTNLHGTDLREADLGRSYLRKANLELAHLSGASLVNANLSGANVVKADLSGANLSRADLSWTDLSWTDLGGADLSGANLWHADLTRADLSTANLRAAGLGGASLTRANLSGANLSGAQAVETSFADVNLSVANGLETVEHVGPSTIGIDTIYKSHGKIPEAFLRGCGLQDWEIELVKLYQPDLVAADLTTILYRVSELRSRAPVRYSSCFISYSTHDQEFAERLHADLQAKGVRCWFAPHDVKGGRKLHEQIDEAIRLHDRLLLILSEHSMSSEWVNTEIAKARKREVKEAKRVLFPVRLVGFETLRDWECFDGDTGKDSAREIREYFIPDFSNWKDHDSYRTAFERLVKDLKAVASSQ